MRRFFVAAVCSGLLGGAGYAEAQATGGNAPDEPATDSPYWNQFRGPNGQGVMAAGDVPIAFGPESNVLWKVAVDEGQSSPVIWGDRIFLASCDADDKRQLATTCLDRHTGEVVWRRTLRAESAGQYYSFNGPASPTPAVNVAHVYVYFGTYGLVCYDHDGTTVWERRFEAPASQYGPSASPILHQDKVILVLDSNDGKSRLVAMDRATGETMWEAARPLIGAGWSTPMIWQSTRGDELIVLGATRLTSYNSDDGSELWWAGGFSIETIGVPVAGEGVLFVTDAPQGGRPEAAWDAEATWKVTLDDYDTDHDGVIQRTEMNEGFGIPLRLDVAEDDDGAVYDIGARQVDRWFGQLDVDGDGQLSRDDWLEFMSGFVMESKPIVMAIRPGASGNARPDFVAWEMNRLAPEMPSPLYHDGRLYLFRDGGVLTCLHAASGEVLYRGRIGALGQYVASPIAAGNTIFAASKDGVVTVLKAGDELGVLANNDFGEEIYATPALGEHSLYLRTAKHLFAIGERP